MMTVIWFNVAAPVKSVASEKGTSNVIDSGAESVPQENTNDDTTAIEVLTGKRIHDSTLEGDRPPHVYRPKTPIYHHHHPENEAVDPEIRKHLLVDHPDLDNNQGRRIRIAPPSDEPSDSVSGAE
ncbi:hypothetical protein A8L45_19440 [Veronia pacifica]|uniref:Uncharacterized protein n=2 Tax=Veronia pacifica TaxID=1080227 RepID=A0A1C3EBT8_9GAMM|nr:hypothetical protein A8L45_19440 [Veronia pacifica]